MSGPVTPIEDPDNQPDIKNPTVYLSPLSSQEVQSVNTKSSKNDLSTEALSTEALQSAKSSLMHVLDTVVSLQNSSTAKENPQLPTKGFSGNPTNNIADIGEKSSINVNEVTYANVVHPTNTDWVQQAQEAIQTAETALSDLKTTTNSDQVNLLLSKIDMANQTIQKALESVENSSEINEAAEKIKTILPEAQKLVNNIQAAQSALTQINMSLTELNTSTSISEIDSLVEKIQAAAATAQQAASAANNQPLALQAAHEAAAAAAQSSAIAKAIKTAYEASIAAQKDLDSAQKTTSPGVLTNLLQDAQQQNEKAQKAAAEAPNSTLAHQAAESTSQIVQQIQSLLNTINELVNNAVSTSSSEGSLNINSAERGISQRVGSLLSASTSVQYTTMIEGLRQMLSVFEANNPSLMDLSGVMKRIITNTSFIRSSRSVKAKVNTLLSKIIEKIVKAKDLSVKDKASLTSIILPALASISGNNTLSVVHFNSIFTNITRILSSLSTGSITSANLIEFTQSVKTLNRLYPSLNNSGRSLVDSTMNDVLKTTLVPQDTLNEAILKNQNISRQKEVLALSTSLGGFFGIMNALEKLSIITNEGSQLSLSGAQEKLQSVLQKVAGSPPPVYMATPMDASTSLVSKLTERFVEETKMADSKQKQKFLLSPSFTHSFVFNVASLIPRR